MKMDGTRRGSMTVARKRRIWTAYSECCGKCRAPVPMTGPGVTYDHHHQLAMDGPDTDEGCWPLCDLCVKPKNKADAQARAKVKRLIEKGKPPAERKPKRGRKLQGPGFQKALRRRMSGKVERR